MTFGNPCSMTFLLHFIGVHLTDLHLIGAYISQYVHLRCVYLMGITPRIVSPADKLPPIHPASRVRRLGKMLYNHLN